MELQPVRRSSLADGVFSQLSESILTGAVPAGSLLPAERQLTEAFGVNRHAVREALKRLAQVGLVEINQGESTRVRDYRRSGGMDLLSRLVVSATGSPDLRTVRSVMEMRSAIGPDAAGRCAERAPASIVDELGTVAGEMATGDPGLRRLGQLDLQFWDLIIDGSENIAYRLALNTLRHVYQPIERAVQVILAPELKDGRGHRAVAAAIAARSAGKAEAAARRLLAKGTAAMVAAMGDGRTEDTERAG